MNNDTQYWCAECRHAECHLCRVSFKLSVANVPIMLNVGMLSVGMLSVGMLSVGMMGVSMLSVGMLSVGLPSVVILNVIMLNVMGALGYLYF